MHAQPSSKFKARPGFPAFSETEIGASATSGVDSYLDAPAYFNKENAEPHLPLTASHATSTSSSPSQSQKSFAGAPLKPSPQKLSFEKCLSPNLPQLCSQNSTSSLQSPDAIGKVAADVNTATFKQLLSGIQPETPQTAVLNTEHSARSEEDASRRSGYQTFGQRPAHPESEAKSRGVNPLDTPTAGSAGVFSSKACSTTRRCKSQEEMQQELELLLQPPSARGRGKSPPQTEEDRLTDYDESELDTDRRAGGGEGGRRSYNSSQQMLGLGLGSFSSLQLQRSCASLVRAEQTPPSKEIQKPFKPSSLTASNQKNLQAILLQQPEQRESGGVMAAGAGAGGGGATPGNAALCQLIEQLSAELEGVKGRLRVVQQEFEAEKDELVKNYESQSQKDHEHFQKILLEQRELTRKDVEQEHEHFLEVAVRERVREARIEWQQELRPALAQASLSEAKQGLQLEKQQIFDEAKASAQQELALDFERQLGLERDATRILLKKQYEEELEKNVVLIREETARTLTAKIGRLEGEVEQRAQQRSEELKLECMQELRSEREKQLYRSLAEKLKQKIEKELYEQLQGEIESELRESVQRQMEESIEDKFKKSYAVKKRQLEERFREKLEEKEAEVREQLQRQVDQLVQEEIARKEKEFRTQAKVRVERMRKELQDKFDREIKEELALERQTVQTEKAELARLRSTENVRMRKLEDHARQLEARLAAKEREFTRYRAEMQELEVAHRNLKKTWMQQASPGPALAPAPTKSLSTDRERTARSALKTLPLGKLNSTLGGGSFHSARGTLKSESRAKKALTQKVLPTSLKKKLLQHKRKKNNSAFASNSVNVSHNSQPPLPASSSRPEDRRASLSPSLPSCATSVPRSHHHLHPYAESEDTLSERGEFLATEHGSACGGYGGAFSTIYHNHPQEDAQFDEDHYNLPRQVGGGEGYTSRSSCQVYSADSTLPQQEDDEPAPGKDMEGDLKKEYSLLAWTGSQKIKNMIEEKCQLNMVQRIQQLGGPPPLEHSDESEENNTFGLEVAEDLLLNLKGGVGGGLCSSSDVTPTKEVTPNFLKSKLSGKKKHNFKLEETDPSPVPALKMPATSGRAQVRFEPGKEDLFESYITRFREKEAVFEQSYQTDAQRIVQTIETSFLELGTSEHGLLGYLCDLWESLGIAFEHRVNFLHEIEKKVQHAHKAADSARLKGVYGLLNEETGDLASKRKEMIAVLSFIRNKEKLAEVVKKNPKNKIKRSEFMNARLSLYHAVEEYRKKHADYVVWKGEILSDVSARLTDQTLKYEKWLEDNELKGEIKQEILEKKKIKY